MHPIFPTVLRFGIAALAFLPVILVGSLAAAQEAPRSGPGVIPPRIVIAPALSELARTIKNRLASERREEGAGAQEQYYFYGARGFEPIWLQRFGRGEIALTRRAIAIQATLFDAASWGLDPGDYDIAWVDPASNVDAAADLELAITLAVLRYGQDTFGGRIAPRSISENLDMVRPRLDPMQLLGSLVESDDPGTTLEALAPGNPEFLELREQLAAAEADPIEMIDIPAGDSLKPDMVDPRVPLLRERLGLGVPAENKEFYDEALVDAVKAFQSGLGLTADGIVGNATRAALNRSANLTRGQILANMEKWRWLPRDLGDFYVQVNIPEYRLWIMADDAPVYETRVVVGTPKNQTPVFFDQIRHVVVNPYWNVPTSIARNEIGPQVLRDPGYLARKEMELMSNGRIIDPWSVDWSSVGTGSFPFQVRQKPGRQNALGQVKFLFPNKHDVYLHDTPEKSLFGADARAFSHGCVRVQSPMEFADALLSNEAGLDASTLEAAYGPKERWFNLKVKVPVFLTYFTVRADGDGTLRSFDDVYGHDKRIIAALEGSGKL